MKKIFISLLIGCFSSVWATPAALTLSHTEGKGLGYKEGYTSLDFTAVYDGESLFPLIDLRGHVFNNGQYAANAGAGIRWLDLCSEQIWGASVFYDTFFLKRLPGHQVGVGVEWITCNFDISINGYIPVGSRKKTNIYTLSYGLFRNGFLAEATEQAALGGVDMELGYRFFCNDFLDLYASLGPYFYCGKTEKTKNAFRAIDKEAYGGRLRAIASFLGGFELEGIASYDSRFKWTGQATVSIDLFDVWNYFQGCANRSCCIQDRLSQPVRRNEMMVIDTVRRFSSNPLILDPEFEP